MPVKIEANFGGVSPHHCFDSEFYTDFKDFSEEVSGICSDICSPHMPCDDIWNKFDDFLLTPPQSPPIKFDLVSDLLDMSSLDSLGVDSSGGHSVDVLHDCMWSGQCTEDANTSAIHNSCSSSIRMCTKNHSRPETPFMSSLSTSPLSMYAFNDILSTGESSSNEDMDEDSHSSVDDSSSPSQSRCSLLQPSKTSFNKVKESLINDHSYDASINRILKSKNSNVYGTQSLIYPSNNAHTRPNPKVKCHKMKIIKANQISRSESKGEQKPQVVPTVRIIRNNQNFVVKTNEIATNKKNTNANVESEQKHCKFSTRRKASTVSSERNAMFAQNHSLKLTNLKNCADVRCSDGNDSDSMDKSPKVPPMRRREHNDSERKRRDHLRNSFLNLRDQIPKLKSAEKKPPRILILSEATAYVEQLKEKQKYLERTLNAENEKRERLLRRLSELKETDDDIVDEEMHEY